MKKLNTSGFGVVEVLLSLVAVGIIAGAGFYVYKANKNTNESLDKTGTSEITKSDKKTETKQPEQVADTSHLIIKEFNVKIPIDAQGLKGVRYSITADTDTYNNSRKVITLATDRVDAIKCVNNPNGERSFNQTVYVYDNRDAADNSQIAGPEGVKQIGNKFFAFNRSTGDGSCEFAPQDKATLDQFRKAALEAFNNLQAS